MFLIKCIPDCPGGGNPEGPLGRHRRTVRTAALPPEHGSKAIGLGGAFEERKWEETHLDTVRTSQHWPNTKLHTFVKAEIYKSTGIYHFTDCHQSNVHTQSPRHCFKHYTYCSKSLTFETNHALVELRDVVTDPSSPKIHDLTPA